MKLLVAGVDLRDRVPQLAGRHPQFLPDRLAVTHLLLLPDDGASNHSMTWVLPARAAAARHRLRQQALGEDDLAAPQAGSCAHTGPARGYFGTLIT
jgi:hypothetical protein